MSALDSQKFYGMAISFHRDTLSLATLKGDTKGNVKIDKNGKRTWQLHGKEEINESAIKKLLDTGCQ